MNNWNKNHVAEVIATLAEKNTMKIGEAIFIKVGKDSTGLEKELADKTSQSGGVFFGAIMADYLASNADQPLTKEIQALAEPTDPSPPVAVILKGMFKEEHADKIEFAIAFMMVQFQVWDFGAINGRQLQMNLTAQDFITIDAKAVELLGDKKSAVALLSYFLEHVNKAFERINELTLDERVDVEMTRDILVARLAALA